jgi:hypothetical protein
MGTRFISRPVPETTLIQLNCDLVRFSNGALIGPGQEKTVLEAIFGTPV